MCLCMDLKLKLLINKSRPSACCRCLPRSLDNLDCCIRFMIVTAVFILFWPLWLLNTYKSAADNNTVCALANYDACKYTNTTYLAEHAECEMHINAWNFSVMFYIMFYVGYLVLGGVCCAGSLSAGRKRLQSIIADPEWTPDGADALDEDHNCPSGIFVQTEESGGWAPNCWEAIGVANGMSHEVTTAEEMCRDGDASYEEYVNDIVYTSTIMSKARAKGWVDGDKGLLFMKQFYGPGAWMLRTLATAILMPTVLLFGAGYYGEKQIVPSLLDGPETPCGCGCQMGRDSRENREAEGSVRYNYDSQPSERYKWGCIISPDTHEGVCSLVTSTWIPVQTTHGDNTDSAWMPVVHDHTTTAIVDFLGAACMDDENVFGHGCFQRRFTFGCDTTSAEISAFEQTLGCSMLFSADAWSVGGIFVWIILQLLNWAYYFHAHKQTRSAPKKSGPFKYVKAAFHTVLNLYFVFEGLRGSSVLAMVLAPAKIVTLIVSVKASLDEVNDHVLYIDAPAAFIESVFLMAVNKDWWIVLFFEHPLHWLSAPAWAQQGLNVICSRPEARSAAEHLLAGIEDEF